MKEKEKLPKSNIKSQTRWAGVENALGEGTFSGYMMGVLETEKIFREILREKRIPGLNFKAQIKYVRQYFSQPEKLEQARETYFKIVENLNPTVNQQETKDAIAGYWQAIKDIEEALSQISLKQKIGFRLKYFYQRFFRISKDYIVNIIFFLLLILFLYETNLGRNLAWRVGQGTHVLVFKILPWVVGTILGLLILFYVWKIINRKRDKI